jgi:hypothetical protein
VFKGSITLIEGELYPTSPWLIDAVSCIFALCRNDGETLYKIIKNDHDLELNNAKIKKSCQFIVEHVQRVCHFLIDHRMILSFYLLLFLIHSLSIFSVY